jgi:hypothetical protein
MENEATTNKTLIPTHRESLFWILSPVSCLLSSVSCPIRPSCPVCRRSTNVERALQIVLFLQNKPNFKMGNINISTARTKAYANEQRTMSNERYSKQTQFKPNPIPKLELCSTLSEVEGPIEANSPTPKSPEFAQKQASPPKIRFFTPATPQNPQNSLKNRCLSRISGAIQPTQKLRAPTPKSPANRRPARLLP